MQQSGRNRWDSDDDSSFNSMDFPLPKGFCCVCNKPSTCRCKCGDFYCSGECLNKDWPSHRYICFPMPPLVYSNESCETYDTVYIPMEDKNKQPNATVFSKGNKKVGSAYSKRNNKVRSAYSKGNGQTAASSKNEGEKLINQNNTPKNDTQTSPPSNSDLRVVLYSRDPEQKFLVVYKGEKPSASVVENLFNQSSEVIMQIKPLHN